jgi:hypothetical protein
VIVFCAAAVLAGCGGQVDTAKVTYTRTTVAAGEANNGGENSSDPGKPKANDPAFTMEKLRSIDPCGLLTDDILSAVGKPAENRLQSLGDCSNYMKDKDGKDLSITIYVGETADNAADADLNIGGLPGVESELTGGDACFVTVVTSTSPNFGIKLQVGGEAEDLCEPGRAIMTSVVDLIRDDPPVREDEQGGLATVDPCEVLDAATVKTTLGADATVDPYTLHWCDWIGDGVKLGIWLHTGYDPKETSNGAQPVDLGGVTAYQEATQSGGVSCSLDWLHRATGAEGEAEIVTLSVDKSAPAQGDNGCPTAQAAAKLVIAALPKP